MLVVKLEKWTHGDPQSVVNIGHVEIENIGFRTGATAADDVNHYRAWKCMAEAVRLLI